MFDEKKLLWLNGQYIRSASSDKFAEDSLINIEYEIGRELFRDEKERLLKIFPSVQERIETLNDLLGQVKFLIDEPFILDNDDWNSVNSEESQSYLNAIRDKFIRLEDFNLNNIEEVMRSTLDDLDLKTKVGFQATRVAITGTKISPPLFESIFALGKETCIARLSKSVENNNN